MSASERSQGQTVAFDGFIFDRRTHELRRGGALVPLQQQPARVLALLLEHPGELVDRDELRQRIWGEDTFVDFSHGLNYCIRQIRAALSDTADSPRYIETLRGRGYRFIGKLQAAPLTTAVAPMPAKARIRPVVAVPIAALAVALMVWTGMAWLRPSPSKPPAIGIARFATGTGADQKWTEALQAQLLARLPGSAHVPVVDLASMAPSTAHSGWRVEGRVDRSNLQYRVTITLRKPDGSVRWSDIFDGPPGDWIDAQNEMARIITRAILYYVEGPLPEGIPRRAPRRQIP